MMASMMESTSTSTSKERKRRHRWEQKNRWMAHYELKYGVAPTEFVLAGTDNGGSAVASATAATTTNPSAALTIDGIPVVLKAKCRFCECFGRETTVSSNGSGSAGLAVVATSGSVNPSMSKSRGGSAPEDEGEPDDAGDFAAAVVSAVTTTGGSGAGGASGSGNELSVGGSDAPRASKRRKKRQTLKVFGPNFRTDNLESHLSREHPVKWREYERLRDSDKKDFFPDVPVFKEFLVAAAAAAAAASQSHPQQQQQPHQQQQVQPQQQQQLGGSAAAINLTPQLQQNALPPHHTDTAVVAAASASTSNASASAAGLVGFSPSGFLGGKMLSFADKPAQQGSSSSASGTQSSKHLVPVSVMDMVDQLLSSRAVAAPAGASLDAGASQSWWHQFVQMDTTLDASALPAPVDLKRISAAGGDTFALTIRNDALFAFVVDAFRHGLSLDATLAMVHAAERYLLDPLVFGAVARADVVACVRTVASVNLAAISMLTAFAWGYAVLLRFVTRYSTGYVDVRVQVAVNNEIQDMHVLAVPVDTHKHSPEAVAAAVVRALTAVDARALEKIIGVTVDGDPYHMQKYKAVAQHLRTDVARATNNAAFYVLHSGAYHINMVVEELLEICQEEFAILATIADLEALCAASVSLMDEMGPEPVPRSHGAHWIHVLTMCEWLAMQREALTKWCHDHNELHHIPSNTSWVVVFLLRDILKDVYAVYIKCVEHSSTFADVQRHLRELIFQLRLKFNVKTVGAAPSGVATSDSGVVASDAAMSAAVAASQSFLDLSEFSYQDFVDAVIPLDLFMYEAFQLKTIDGVGENERVHIHERFNALIFLLISKFQGLVSVSAEASASPPGSGVDASATSPFPDFHQYNADIPPSTPYELITMNNVAFMALLNSQQFRIRSKWAGKVLTMITEERNRMITEFSLRSSFYDAVSLAAKQQQQHGSVALRDAWRATSVQFASLSGFAVAFGCLLAVPKPEHEIVRHGAQPLSNVQLEAQLHAQQFDRLALLRKHFDTVV